MFPHKKYTTSQFHSSLKYALSLTNLRLFNTKLQSLLQKYLKKVKYLPIGEKSKQAISLGH